ncbi:MAG: hypothetical protein K2Y32_22310 [Candidatus Obscuribacterales bacterium]|nr:hypothetical protein [Candidatus Obscuribacterales bacterium]
MSKLSVIFTALSIASSVSLAVTMPAALAQASDPANSKASLSADGTNSTQTGAQGSAQASPQANTQTSAKEGLWSLPKYEVKVKPQQEAQKPTPKLGPKAEALAKAKAKEKEKIQEADSNQNELNTLGASLKSQPTYVWSPANSAAKLSADARKVREQALLDYNKEVADKIAGGIKIPQQATLVESESKKYRYLIGFHLTKEGKAINIQVLDRLGELATEPLADQNESASVVSALKNAIRQASPLKTPPQGSGIAPWQMIALYDVSTGKLVTGFRPLQ